MTTIADAWQSFAEGCAKRGTEVSERDKVAFYAGANALASIMQSKGSCFVGVLYADLLSAKEEIDNYLASQERPTDLS